MLKARLKPEALDYLGKFIRPEMLEKMSTESFELTQSNELIESDFWFGTSGYMLKIYYVNKRDFISIWVPKCFMNIVDETKEELIEQCGKLISFIPHDKLDEWLKSEGVDTDELKSKIEKMVKDAKLEISDEFNYGWELKKDSMFFRYGFETEKQAIDNAVVSIKEGDYFILNRRNRVKTKDFYEYKNLGEYRVINNKGFEKI